jgi:hypothetical protein
MEQKGRPCGLPAQTGSAASNQEKAMPTTIRIAKAAAGTTHVFFLMKSDMANPPVSKRRRGFPSLPDES